MGGGRSDGWVASCMVAMSLRKWPEPVAHGNLLMAKLCTYFTVCRHAYIMYQCCKEANPYHCSHCQ